MPILFLLQIPEPQEVSVLMIVIPLVFAVLVAVPLYILLLRLIKAFIDWLKRH